MSIMPPITKNLIIINVIMFLAKMVGERYGMDLDSALGLHFLLASDFHLYQLVTYMFMHGGISHLFFNMFALWMFGRTMEAVWGPRRYLTYFLTCGIGAGVVQECWQLINYFFIDGLTDYTQVNLGGMLMSVDDYLNLWTTIGASGACYAILLGFGMTFPEERILLLIPPIPIKAKYFVAGYAVIELLSGLNYSGDKVAHFAHLGGMLFGFLIIRYWRNQDNNRTNRFTGWENYRPRKKSWAERMRDRLRHPLKAERPQTRHSDDYRYNEARRKRNEAIDPILKKISQSGYDSLTESEKKALFDASRR